MRLRTSTTNNSARALRTTRSAFTLLEVLVVVAIIVMLAGVGGFYFLQRYQEAQVSRAKSDVRLLAGQIDTYFLKTGQYPPSIEALAQPMQLQDGTTGAPLARADALKDPWGRVYQFSPPDGAQTFEPIVFTTSPKGVQISSAQEAK